MIEFTSTFTKAKKEFVFVPLEINVCRRALGLSQVKHVGWFVFLVSVNAKK